MGIKSNQIWSAFSNSMTFINKIDLKTFPVCVTYTTFLSGNFNYNLQNKAFYNDNTNLKFQMMLMYHRHHEV